VIPHPFHFLLVTTAVLLALVLAAEVLAVFDRRAVRRGSRR
jgi:hypothetical protein